MILIFTRRFQKQRDGLAAIPWESSIGWLNRLLHFNEVVVSFSFLYQQVLTMKQ